MAPYRHGWDAIETIQQENEDGSIQLLGDAATFYCTRQGNVTCRLLSPIPSVENYVIGMYSVPHFENELDSVQDAFIKKNNKKLFQGNITDYTFPESEDLLGTHNFFVKLNEDVYYSDPILTPQYKSYASALVHENNNEVMIRFDDLPHGYDPVSFACTGLLPNHLVDYDCSTVVCEPSQTLERSTCADDAGFLDWLNHTIRRQPENVEAPRHILVVRQSMTMVSAFLSMMGSVFIIYVCCIRWKNGRSTTRDRLLTGLSSLDACSSLANFFGPIATPYWAVRNAIWASGNQFTCSVQGMGNQFGISVPIYNAMLCTYFFLVIIAEVPAKRIARWYEWFLHALPLSFGLMVAIFGVVTKNFNSNGTSCWFEPSPKDCIHKDFHGMY